ncbi:MAG: deoxyribose-phosphate aldolase [Clostridiales bacterium]|nr:deoxyribose-phosphate aldolase [Clostridiales bacterium]
MTKQEIMAHVDHTLLKADADWLSIRKLCEEAVRYGAASVCIPPAYVAAVKEAFGDKPVICTVVGFPLGYSATGAKLEEARQALVEGATEIDMVVNLTHVKNKNYSAVTGEIRKMKELCGSHILKVIVETCYLTEEEKISLCGCVTEGGADYIKTSTGFGSAGATLEDVALFRKHIGPAVKIKAAGGIRTKEDLVAFILAGCDRVGASAAVTALYGNAG